MRLGRLGVFTLCALLLVAPVASAGQNVLTWTDNSTNEANFNIERAPGSCVVAPTFTALATVGANVTTFTDTAVVEGSTYCYRVNASNTAGVSGYSNTVSRTVPFSAPAAPSNLIVQ